MRVQKNLKSKILSLIATVICLTIALSCFSLPVLATTNVLKIDMSFLHEIKDRERSRIILKSVISMADSLGMDVITEGVETEQQLLSLSAMGCNHFQGYFFSRPIPVDEFEMKYSSVD